MTGKIRMLRFMTLYVIVVLSAQVARGTETEPHLAVERPPVILSLGEQRLVTIPSLKRYSFGAPLLRALPSPDGAKDAVLLKAVQAGITDWMVWKTDGSLEHRSIEVGAVCDAFAPEV